MTINENLHFAMDTCISNYIPKYYWVDPVASWSRPRAEIYLELPSWLSLSSLSLFVLSAHTAVCHSVKYKHSLLFTFQWKLQIPDNFFISLNSKSLFFTVLIISVTVKSRLLNKYKSLKWRRTMLKLWSNIFIFLSLLFLKLYLCQF